MRILIAYASKRGGTRGLAEMLGEALSSDGADVETAAAEDVSDLSDFDAVIVGGALYMFRWHRAARRFVKRHAEALRRVPVWFFSSGPLDDSASERVLPPLPQVQRLMTLVGARGHATFGGRLLPDDPGLFARAMTKEHAGDFRSPRDVARFATEISRALGLSRPLVPPERSGPEAGASA